MTGPTAGSESGRSVPMSLADEAIPGSVAGRPSARRTNSETEGRELDATGYANSVSVDGVVVAPSEMVESTGHIGPS